MMINDQEMRLRSINIPGLPPPLIEEYNPNHQNPISYDLTIGDSLEIMRRSWWRSVWDLTRYGRITKKSIYWESHSLIGTTEADPFYVAPGDRLLTCVRERTNIPDDLNAQLFLRSTAAREFWQQLDATLGDSGFSGYYTLELKNESLCHMPIWEGMRLVQIVFNRNNPPETSYGEIGHYQGQTGVTFARKNNLGTIE